MRWTDSFRGVVVVRVLVVIVVLKVRIKDRQCMIKFSPVDQMRGWHETYFHVTGAWDWSCETDKAHTVNKIAGRGFVIFLTMLERQTVIKTTVVARISTP